MKTYFAAVLKDQGSAYGVIFPDIPGCFSAGDTFEEAVANAEEALRQHADVAAENGLKLPEPRGFDELLADPAVRKEIGGVPLIAVPLMEATDDQIEVSLSVDRALYDAIVDAADASGMTRADFLAAAAREKIAS